MPQRVPVEALDLRMVLRVLLMQLRELPEERDEVALDHIVVALEAAAPVREHAIIRLLALRAHFPSSERLDDGSSQWDRSHASRGLGHVLIAIGVHPRFDRDFAFLQIHVTPAQGMKPPCPNARRARDDELHPKVGVRSLDELTHGLFGGRHDLARTLVAAPDDLDAASRIDGDHVAVHRVLEHELERAEDLARGGNGDARIAEPIAKLTDGALRELAYLRRADAIREQPQAPGQSFFVALGVWADVVPDVPFVDREVMAGHALAALLATLAVPKERLAGLLDRDLESVWPKRSDRELALDIDTKRIGGALGLELLALPAAGLVDEVHRPGGLHLARARRPAALSDRGHLAFSGRRDWNNTGTTVRHSTDSVQRIARPGTEPHQLAKQF